MSRNESFNYAIFDPQEQQLLGCVSIDPPEAAGHDAEVCWWIVDGEVGGPLDRWLDVAIPRWLEDHWPLNRPRVVGRDITWDDWQAEAARDGAAHT